MLVGDDVPRGIEFDTRVRQKLRIRDQPDEHKQAIRHQLRLHTIRRGFDTSKFIVFDQYFVSRRTNMERDFAFIDILLQLFLQHIARSEPTTHHQVDMCCVACQKNRFLHCRVAAAHNDQGFVAIKRPVTCRTVVYATPVEFILAGYTEFAVITAGGEQYCLGVNWLPIDDNFDMIVNTLETRRLAVFDFCTKSFRLPLQFARQFHARDAFGEPRIIIDLIRDRRHTTHNSSLVQHRRNILACRINRRRQRTRACADNN